MIIHTVRAPTVQNRVTVSVYVPQSWRPADQVTGNIDPRRAFGRPDDFVREELRNTQTVIVTRIRNVVCVLVWPGSWTRNRRVGNRDRRKRKGSRETVAAAWVRVVSAITGHSIFGSAGFGTVRVIMEVAQWPLRRLHFFNT